MQQAQKSHYPIQHPPKPSSWKCENLWNQESYYLQHTLKWRFDASRENLWFWKLSPYNWVTPHHRSTFSGIKKHPFEMTSSACDTMCLKRFWGKKSNAHSKEWQNKKRETNKRWLYYEHEICMFCSRGEESNRSEEVTIWRGN